MAEDHTMEVAAVERSALVDIAIDSATMDRYPAVQVSAVVAVGIDRTTLTVGKAAIELLADAIKDVRGRFDCPEAVLSDERISSWRTAIRSCGLKPSDIRSSCEQLIRRLMQHNDLGATLPIVTAYCALSAKHVAPLGGYDIDRLPVNLIALRPARSQDSFEPIGHALRAMPLDPRVIVYGSGDEVVCWAFNHRDSARTALRAETTRALFVGEAVTFEQRHSVTAAFAELSDVLTRLGAHVGEIGVANASRPLMTLAPRRP